MQAFQYTDEHGEGMWMFLLLFMPYRLVSSFEENFSTNSLAFVNIMLEMFTKNSHNGIV